MIQAYAYDNTEIGAAIYTDGRGMIGKQNEAVKGSVGECVNGMAQASGLESFWSSMKRALYG